MGGIAAGLGGAAQGASTGMMIGGPYGAAIGAIAGGLIAGLSPTPHFSPSGYTPVSPVEGQGEFLQQGANLPAVSGVLQQANSIDNADYQKQASQFAPNLMGNIKQSGVNTSALLGGNLTPGVQSALGKPGATGRDLGLTSDQLMLQGAQQLPGEERTATGLNPFNVTSTSTLQSPAALLARRDQEDMYNNSITNQNAIGKFNASQSNSLASVLGLAGSAVQASLKGMNNGSSGSNNSLGYGFGQGDTGPTADSQFDATGAFIGGGGGGFG